LILIFKRAIMTKEFNLQTEKMGDEASISSSRFVSLRSARVAVKANALSSHLDTARVGEKIAKKYLENKGYKIIEQNAKTKFFEIDIVAFLKKCLVIVEVRTKKGENFGSPEESLNKKKLKKLLFGAQLYVARKKWKGDYRIDAVCLVLKTDNTLKRIEHYENIII